MIGYIQIHYTSFQLISQNFYNQRKQDLLKWLTDDLYPDHKGHLSKFEISWILAQFKLKVSKLNSSLAELGPAQPQLVA